MGVHIHFVAFFAKPCPLQAFHGDGAAVRAFDAAQDVLWINVVVLGKRKMVPGWFFRMPDHEFRHLFGWDDVFFWQCPNVVDDAPSHEQRIFGWRLVYDGVGIRQYDGSIHGHFQLMLLKKSGEAEEVLVDLGFRAAVDQFPVFFYTNQLWRVVHKCQFTIEVFDFQDKAPAR